MADERAAFAGQIADLPVVDLLRTISNGKKTGIARFETSLGTATLWFRTGTLVDAEMGQVARGAAVRRLLGADAGSFEVEFKPVVRHRLIQEDTSEFIREAEPPPAAALNRGPAAGRARAARATWQPTGENLAERAPLPQPSPTSTRNDAPTPEADAPAARTRRDRITGETPQANLEALNRVANKTTRKSIAPVSAQAPSGSSTPRQANRTSMGIPAQAGTPTPKARSEATKHGWTFLDPTARAQSPNAENDPGRTMMRAGPMAIPRAPKHARRPPRPTQPPLDGRPVRVDSSEDISDPIPVGTSWSAPAHVSGSYRAVQDDPRPAGQTQVAKPATSKRSQTLVAVKPQTRPPPPPPPKVSRNAKPPALPQPYPSPTATKPSPTASAPGREPDAPAPTAEAERSPSGGTSAAQVGRYEVLLRIARGGMGTVYLCQVTGEGGFRRLFALKVIRDHLSRNEDYVRMMLQEARIASRLHHPNVVGIVDIGNFANQHYLVMDYVEGCTLSELLKVHRKTRPPHLIIPILLDALTGLHAAHTLTDDDGSPLTLVHCDFSPQNMLLGTNGICRITDFGIARAAKALPERSSVTRGKPAYLAPEQVTGQPFDHRADVFAAGVVLWTALTGEQLFAGKSPVEVLDKVLNLPVPPPSSVGLRPPRKLDPIVLRALQRDPDQRYQTAEEMLIDLRKVAIAEGLLAPSSDVAKWVTDTFGAQFELRRQAAGLSPNGPNKVGVHGAGLGDEPGPAGAALAGAGTIAADDSATQALAPSGPQPLGSDASNTMMLRSGPQIAAPSAVPPAPAGRHRKLALGGVIVIAATLLAVAVVRPDLLRGGMVDENGGYFELAESPDDEAIVADPAPEPSPAAEPAPKSGANLGPEQTADAKGSSPAPSAPVDPPPPEASHAEEDVPTSEAGDPPPPKAPRRPPSRTRKTRPAKPTPPRKPAASPPPPAEAKPDSPDPAPAGRAAPKLPPAPDLTELIEARSSPAG